MVANVYASATEGIWNGQAVEKSAPGSGAAGTIDCPDVGTRLTAVPEEAKSTVDEQLAVLDQQIAKAYQQLQNSAQGGQSGGDGSVEDTIMKPLKEQRAATIGRIADAIDRAGHRPEGLDALAECSLRPAQDQGQDGRNGQGQDQNGQDQGSQGGGQGQNGQGQNGQGQGQNQQGGGQQQGNGGQAGNGPVAADYVDITTVQPNAGTPQPQADASRGSFTSSCGVNANGLRNSDNVIVAPGVTNGAHHFHDYVGNQSNTAFASDDDLAAGDTSCADKGDKSTYYWPVIRLQDGSRERDADSPGGGTEGNAGRIVTPKQVTITFEGSPQGKVTAMPRFLRIITGDAKAFVNGPANANASWSCTGFEDRQLKDKYPLCPKGSDVVRTFRFQSCWDGRNIDSANHRTHVAFADAQGACPAGFEAIPQLVQRIVYDVAAPSLNDGGRTTPLFAVDSFPEQLHKPVTDHGDFINVFDDGLMRQMVDCINNGRTCGAGGDQGGNGGSGGGQGGNGGDQGANGGQGGNGGDQGANGGQGGNGGDQGANGGQGGTGGQGGNGNQGGGSGDQGGSGGQQPPQQTEEPTTGTTDTPATQPPANGGGDATAPTVEPKSAGSHSSHKGSHASATPTATAAAGGGEVGTPTQTPAPAQNGQSAGSQTEPQTAGGSLAETGAQLWPAAAGAVLVIAGFLLLRRIRRGAM
ncbi:DUF1996 domain-containing protein [Streptomyces anandii]|uniref:DUF1996 domain-containing protein n=1 Tax=Streptomyces anandii TaxID=285454 RepID=UPI00378A32DB